MSLACNDNTSHSNKRSEQSANGEGSPGRTRQATRIGAASGTAVTCPRELRTREFQASALKDLLCRSASGAALGPPRTRPPGPAPSAPAGPAAAASASVREPPPAQGDGADRLCAR